MKRGIYCLVLKSHGATLRIGQLGERIFRRGYYIYVGSALGSAGLSRVKRHLALAATRDRRPRWHLDYLLLCEDFSPVRAVCGYTNERKECVLARELGGERVPGFGSSDCDCESHLLYRRRDPAPEILSAFARLGIPATSKRINIDRR